MARLREYFESRAKPLFPSRDWIELVLDLDAPLVGHAPDIAFAARWAVK